ncbi:glutamate receptor 2-like [Lineus longissimus]|uniref:glutamate receptor 2-like n=1 Tax=Lineus longissimus TaxID=88925 RepID=UPI002B4F3BC3
MEVNMASMYILLLFGLVQLGLAQISSDKALVRVKRQGVNLTVTSVLSPPFLMEVKGAAASGYDRYEGFIKDILHEISKKIGMAYTLKVRVDNSYSGMITQLVNKEVDMAVGPITITSQRAAKVDMTKPFMNAGITIMMNRRDAVSELSSHSYSLDVVLRPFGPVVWVCIILAAFVVIGCFYLINRFDPNEKHACRHGDKKKETESEGEKELPFSFLACLWMVLGGLTIQGYTKRPQSAAALVLFFAWWVFCLIVFAFYVGGIMKSGIYGTTNPGRVSKFKSFDDLVRQTEVQFGTVDGGSTFQFFRTSKVEVYQRAARMMTMVPTLSEGVERVRKSRYALLAESPYVEYVSTKKPCNTMQVGGLLNSFGYGFGLPKGSPHKDAVNAAILQLQEDQILQMLFNKWWNEFEPCTKVSQPRESINDMDREQLYVASSLSMGNVGGVFIIFFVGIFLAMIVMLLEILVHRRRQAKKLDTPKEEKKDEQLLQEVAEA